MKKSSKVILIVATACVVAGMLFSGLALAMVGFDVRKLSTSSEYVHKTYDARGENYSEVAYEGLSENIKIERTSGEKIEVSYSENDNHSYLIDDSGDRLTIKEEHTPSFMTWDFRVLESRGVIIKVPNSFSGTLTISTASGDISVTDIKNLETMKLSALSGGVTLAQVHDAQSVVATSVSGDVGLSSVSAQRIETKSESGSCLLDSVKSQEELQSESTSGDVRIDNISASTISAKTISGNVLGKNVSANTLQADSTSGNISIGANSFDAFTSKTISGNIDVHLEGSSTDYSIKVSSMSGRVSAPSGGEKATRTLNCESTSGDINVVVQ